VLPTVPRRTIFTSSIGAAGVMLVVMSLMGDFVGAAICAAVVGLFAGIAWINGFTMIGQEVADKLRGRVFAFVMSSVRITLLATIALGPVLAGFIGAHQVSVGQFQWLFSGPAVVLAIGGVVAFVVSVFAGRQVGGGAASRALKRALRRRGGGLLGSPAEHRGVLIAVEGRDSELVGVLQDAIVEHVRSAGYRAIAHRPEGGWIVPPSLSSLSSTAGTVITDSSMSKGVTAVAERPRHDDGDLEMGAEQSPAAALRALAVLSERASGRIRPDLDLGSVVVCRDYVDATVVRYGVCGGLDEEQVLQTAVWAVEGVLPDLTVLIDIPTDESDWPTSSSPLSNGSASGSAGSADAGAGKSATPESTDGAAEPGRAGEPASQPGLPLDAAAPEFGLMDERAAYRVRVATAPERYVVVRTTPEPDAALDIELAGRVDSVLRLRAPELAEPVVVGDRDGRDAA
jgi:dTMP kinase